MKRTDHSAVAGSNAGAAGFTLVEMLVVMVIIALALAIAVPTLRRPPDAVRLEAAARNLAAALRLSRAHAIARNAEIALEIDVERKAVRSAALAAFRFDPDIMLKLTVASPERRGHSAGTIRFFPDGTSSGGDVVLSLGGRQIAVASAWLTGATRLETIGRTK